MRIGMSNMQTNASFGDIKFKYYSEASKAFKCGDRVDMNLIKRLRMEDAVFDKKEMTKKDATDTLEAMRRFVAPFYLHDFDRYMLKFKD